MKSSSPSIIGIEKQSQIISLYLSGISRDEIARQATVGTGTVSKIIKELEKKLGKNDITAMRVLAKELQKVGILPQQCLQGARIHSIIDEFGLESDELGTFISESYNSCKKYGLEASELVELSSRLFDVQKESGMDFEDIPEHYEELKDKKESLIQEIATLKTEKADSDEALQKSLKYNKLVIQQVDQYSKLRDELKRLTGIDIIEDELSKLVNMLGQVSSLGYNAKTIAEYTAKESSFEARVAQLKDEIAQLKDQQGKKQEELADLKDQVDSEQDTISEIQRLKSLGVYAADLEKLYATLAAIGKARGIDDKRIVLQGFSDDVSVQYDKKLGFEQEISRLESEIAAKKTEHDSISERLEKTKSDKKDLQDSIRIIKDLQKNGIDYQRIIRWDKVVVTKQQQQQHNNNDKEEDDDDAIVDVRNLDDLISKYGSLSNVVAKLDSKNTELDSKKKRLESQIRTLKNQKSELEYNTRQLKETMIATIKEAREQAVSAILATRDSAKSSISSVSNQSVNDIKTTTLQTRQSLAGTAANFEQMITAVSDSSIEVGRLATLKPICDIINGQNPNTALVFASMLALLQSFGNWSLSRVRQTYGFKIAVDNMISKIEDELGSSH